MVPAHRCARVISKLLVNPGAARHDAIGMSCHATCQLQTIPAGRGGEHFEVPIESGPSSCSTADSSSEPLSSVSWQQAAVGFRRFPPFTATAVISRCRCSRPSGDERFDLSYLIKSHLNDMQINVRYHAISLETMVNNSIPNTYSIV